MWAMVSVLKDIFVGGTKAQTEAFLHTTQASTTELQKKFFFKAVLQIA